MTDFNKVRHYYSHFDEKNRLRNDNSGKLEFLMTMQILEKYLPAVNAGEKAGADAGARENSSILDLGGGAGIYSFPLAKKGYQVTLADLSEEEDEKHIFMLQYYIRKSQNGFVVKRDIYYVYEVDIEVNNEEEILNRNIRDVSIAPNRNYEFKGNGDHEFLYKERSYRCS